MKTLRLISLNVRGVSLPTSINKILGIYHKLKSNDVILFQETKIRNSLCAKDFNQLFENDYHIYHSYATDLGSGVVTLIRKGSFSACTPIYISKGRIIVIKATRFTTTVNFWNFYLPAKKSDCVNFLETIDITKFFSYKKELNVVGGDFNFVENVLDALHPNANLFKPSKIFNEKIKESLNIEDFFLTKFSKTFDYSFNYRNGTQKTRIDRIYVSLVAEATLCNMFYEHFNGFDHKALYTLLSEEIFQQSHGPSYAKLGTDVLPTEIFRRKASQIMIDFINNYVVEDSDFDQFFYNYDKMKCSVLTIGIESMKEIVRKNKYEIMKLKAEIERIGTFHTNTERINTLQDQIHCIELKSIQKSLKGTLYEDRMLDKSTIASAKKEAKYNILNKYIHSLKTETGESKFDNADIMNIMIKRFQQLFSSEGYGVQQEQSARYFGNLVEKKFDEQNSRRLTKQITIYELRRAINGFKNNKSPGYDGFPIEFYKHTEYKTMWEIILLCLFNKILTKNALAPSMYMGIISLLYKGKGERDNPSNWRPISLLNVDYKIFAKIITNRLRPFMGNLIGGEQFCSVQGRDIQKAIRLLDDTIFYAESEKQPLIVLSIDQQQAFDRVEWDFMFLVLEKLGLPQQFIGIIKAIYSKTNVRSNINVNGFISKSINITRGIRQGCPLSALLYVMVQESFACAIRKNIRIHGIRIPTLQQRIRYHLKMVAYADDMNVILTDTNSINELFTLARYYGSASGQIIGMHKTQILYNDNTGPLPDEFRQYRKEKLEILGHKFDRKGLIQGTENWTKFNNFMQMFTGITPHKQISWRGRVKTILTYAFALFQFKSWNVSQTMQETNRIEKLWSNYVFHPLPKRIINIKNLYLPLNLGGINFPCLTLRLFSQKIAFISQSLNARSEIWSKFFNYYYTIRNRNGAKVPLFYKNMEKIKNQIHFDFILENGTYKLYIENKEITALNINSSNIYKQLILNKYKRFYDEIKSRWNSDMNEIGNSVFSNSVSNWKLPTPSYVKNFSYEIQLRAVYTNVKKYRFQKCISPNCVLCNKEPETLMHIMCNCEVSSAFWSSNIKPILQILVTENIHFENDSILFSAINIPKEKRTIFNYVMAIARWSIWEYRYLIINNLNPISPYQNFKSIVRKNLFFTKINSLTYYNQHKMIKDVYETITN